MSFHVIPYTMLYTAPDCKFHQSISVYLARNRGCLHGKCVAPNQCSCEPGWNLDASGIRCEARCDQPCLNGNVHIYEARKAIRLYALYINLCSISCSLCVYIFRCPPKALALDQTSVRAIPDIRSIRITLSRMLFASIY